MAREIRLDRARLAKAQRTPQGFVRVDARLTRTGILTYTNPDGSVRKELRPESEVFDAKSLESLRDVTVTHLHPPEMVGPHNATKYARGHGSGEARRDGQFVAHQLIVQDGEMIADIDAGKLAEISCGYSCDYDPTPGAHQGEHYDGVQRNIQYNHVAIGPSAWGRAGAEVCLRLDSGDAAPVPVARFDVGESADDTERDNPTRTPSGAESMSLKIKGVEIKLDAAEATIVQAEIDGLTQRAAAAEAQVAELQTAAGANAVQLQAATARADSAEKRAAKFERAELEAEARVALGAAFKFDGKSDAEIRAAVVKQVLPAVRMDGADAAFIQGAYAAAVVQATKLAGERTEAAAQSGSRSDSNDNSPEKAREQMIAERRKLALSQS